MLIGVTNVPVAVLKDPVAKPAAVVVTIAKFQPPSTLAV